MRYHNWTVVALLNSPWEGTADFPWLRGARDANVIRHLRFRMFPQAEYSMWIDGKHQLAVDPVKIFDDVLNKPDKHTAVFIHENQRWGSILRYTERSRRILGHCQLSNDADASYRCLSSADLKSALDQARILALGTNSGSSILYPAA